MAGLEEVRPPSHIFGMPGLVQRLMDLLRRGLKESSGDAHLQALQLLKGNLSLVQRNQLEVLNYFEVIGGDSGTRYRIHFGTQNNVEVFDDFGNRTRLCFMPKGYLPTGDTMLAQKIALELFETEALRVANRDRIQWAEFSERSHYGIRY
jgi:hypothetical protein